MKLFANIAYEKSAFINLFFFILFYFRDGVKLAGVDHEGFSKTVPEPKPFACRTTSCAIRVRCIVYHANQTVNHQIEVYKYLPSLVLSFCFSLAFLSILTNQKGLSLIFRMQQPFRIICGVLQHILSCYHRYTKQSLYVTI